MPVFHYTALDAAGKQIRGNVEADSARDARRRIREKKLHILHLEESLLEGSRSHRRGAEVLSIPRLGRIGQRRIAVMTRQLSTLLRAGMPLVPALGALAEQLRGEPLEAIMLKVRDRVNQGASLADALAEHPKLFSHVYINMVRAGEAAGALDAVLQRLAEVGEQQVNLRIKVASAMAYPALMAIVGTGVILFLLSFVLPTITKLFQEMKQSLPWPTLALIRLSTFCQSYLWVLLLAAAGVLAAARGAISLHRGRRVWDRLKLKMPLFGPLVQKAAMARFARTLGVLISSGIQPVPALEIVKRIMDNTLLADAIERVKERVQRGDSLAEPLRQSGQFPPIVYHMVAVGERSGNLEEGLFHVANAYENEVEATIGALTSLLEPIMIFVMGIVVGFIVVAILLPIFEMNQVVR